MDSQRRGAMLHQAPRRCQSQPRQQEQRHLRLEAPLCTLAQALPALAGALLGRQPRSCSAGRENQTPDPVKESKISNTTFQIPIPIPLRKESKKPKYQFDTGKSHALAPPPSGSALLPLLVLEPPSKHQKNQNVTKDKTLNPQNNKRRAIRSGV